jgi:hypothetical protein
MIFKALLPSCMTNRPPKKICRALSNRQIQPFDKRCVQFRRVFGITQCLLQSPRTPNHRPSLNLHDAIISAGLDDLTIETRWPKDSPDDLLIELESIRGNQWNLSGIHAFVNISEEGQRVAKASFADDR